MHIIDNNKEIEWCLWWGGKLVLNLWSNNSAGFALLLCVLWSAKILD